MKKVPIRYTGLVETGYRDHLFGSGAAWPFPEAVVDVPVAHAIKYLEYSEFEDAREDTSVPLRDLLRDEPPAEKPLEEESEQPEQEAPLVDLSQMTKAQLKEYAHRNFGIELPDTAKKDEMINTVRLQMGKAPK